MKILIIDDDTELCDLLTTYLDQEGFDVAAIHEAQDGLAAAQSGDYAFLILDVMLPGFSGFDLLRQLRRTSAMPVIMLTARGDEVDRIVGLEMGADDYLPKPFNPRELVARIRAIQRRGENGLGNQSGVPGKIMADDIAIDLGTRTVYQNDAEVILTAVEFSLLHALIKRIGQVVNREDLAQEVLGRKLEMFDRSIDVHISSLRKKLGHHIHGVERIKTIRSVGYMYSCTAAV
ncbi:response regulator transcription factor [Desulfobulbus rhabdoformis]|jgi:two-component system response regulator CpxR|uniref:response regulator transcription factor n=1 Tax=Desulfobulbus rhabdoformis TaxID=34032 RepID=UPI0019646558|nr:response regulator transcription factor [Desulfobulbus rhabdoformis]MBM9613673.1 response regulator transcription factor [Desulfobulbus rhabdoformis]